MFLHRMKSSMALAIFFEPASGKDFEDSSPVLYFNLIAVDPQADLAGSCRRFPDKRTVEIPVTHQ